MQPSHDHPHHIQNEKIVDYLELHKNAIAGAVAGAMTAFLTCPLDVVRTRLQVQHLIRDSQPKMNLANTLSYMLKQEGPLGFFKGLGPQLFGLVPSWAIYFTVYDSLKPVLTNATDGKFSPSIIHMAAAIGAGAITNIGTTPFFTVKTRLQTQQTYLKKQKDINPGENKRVVYHGTVDAFRKIVRNEGWKVLWSGLMPSMIGLIHVAIQFPMYEKFKTYAKNRKGRPEGELTLKELMISAAASKVFASAAAYPHEVIRSRLQGQGGLGVEKRYTGVMSVIKMTIKEEGIRGLYSGLGVTLLRTVPAAMLTLSVYEETKRLIDLL